MNSDFSDPMDASLLQLERELQSLTPLPPGRELIRSLQARMEPHGSPGHTNKVHSFPWRRMMTPAAAAAAAVAVMSLNNNRRPAVAGGRPVDGAPENTAPAIKWEPMPMRSEYRALLNAGYVPNENFDWVQQYQTNSVNHLEWRNVTDNSSARHTRRFVVPASYDTADPWSARRRMQIQ